VVDDYGTPLTTKDKKDNEYFVYKAVNAWGDSYRANEFYDVDKKSVFDNGFIQVEDVDNNVIITKFLEEPSKKTAPAEGNVKLSSEKINIYAGTGENAELSNFATRIFKYVGKDLPQVTFKNVETAFQKAKLAFAGKVTDQPLEVQSFLNDVTGKYSPAQAKSLGSKIVQLRTMEWDSNSSRIMKDLIKQSFEQNPDALAKLLATGNAELTHTQDKGKWGKEFPKLLMEVREELRPTQPVSISEKPDTVSQEEWDALSQEEKNKINECF
jgi:predicted NAD-dependent protein-ADP-ribosyltransferase YbiA (DUF1768 family)